MAFRLSHIHDYDHFIAIDIGSYQVRAEVFQVSSGECVLKGRSNVRQNRTNYHNGSISNMQGVAHTIERAILEASNKLENVPEDVIVSFSPEVILHDMVHSQYIRKDSQLPIEMSEIDTIIKKIEYESISRVKQSSIGKYGIVHDDIKLISSSIIAIIIDGKRVNNPLGFTGTRIQIKILNLFVRASEFNIIRSILSSIDKKLISIVPIPLLFPKIIERSECAYAQNVYIDIGFMHTTILFESENEIRSFETFPIGLHTLLEVLLDEYPEKSYVEVEQMLHSTFSHTEAHNDFLDYLLDIVASLLQEREKDFLIENIFLSGGYFLSTDRTESFIEKFHHRYGASIRISPLHQVIAQKTDPHFIICHALSYLAEELLMLRKDPLIRMMRYVLYNYE